MKERPSPIRLPSVGVGGCTPRPRKPTEASRMMRRGRSSVISTVIGPTMLGRTWRKMMTMLERPMERDASIYSSSRISSVLARATRAKTAQPVTPSTTTRLPMLGPMTATMSRIRRMNGMASCTSTARIMMMSNQPR
ncbi:hypothetical protein D3C87_1695440 [compost metagenome]